MSRKLIIWLLALVDAYKAGILHRDFSPGNIIILDDGTGRLIDWDLSKPLSMENASYATPRCATRTVCSDIITPCYASKANMFLIGYMAIHVGKVG